MGKTRQYGYLLAVVLLLVIGTTIPGSAQDRDSIRMKADSLMSVADSVHRLANEIDAEPIYKKAASLYLEAKDFEKQLEAELYIGETYVDRGEIEKGYRMIEVVDSLANILGSKLMQAKAKDRLSMKYYFNDNYKKGLQFIDAAFELGGNSLDSLSLGKIHYHAAVLKWNLYRFEESLSHIKRAESLFKSIDDKFWLAFTYNNMHFS